MILVVGFTLFVIIAAFFGSRWARILLIVFGLLVLIGEVIARVMRRRRSQPAITGTTFTYRSLGKYGDLGNQMFEIAATYAVAHRTGSGFVLPGSVSQLPTLSSALVTKR